ncbi:MAG: STAS-like domain-containing protein [Syntrophothermus sp.]
MIKINIARDFSDTPGARYYTDGPKSGQEFRETMLEKYFEDPSNNTIVEIELDGVEGYGTSFLEESFGGLVRYFGRQRVKSKIILKAEVLTKFKDLSLKYIENAQESILDYKTKKSNPT